MSKGLGQKIAIKFTEILTGDVTGLVPTPVAHGDYFRPIGTATSSSQYSSYAPSRAFDGSTSSYWQTRTTGDQWVQIELAEPTWIFGFRWYIGSSYRPNGFNFQGSNDGETWEGILTGNSPNATGWHEFPTDSPKQYKYYRWTVTSRHSSYLYIYEIELLEAVGNERAFTITGEEYQYVNGPLIDRNYQVERVERYGIVPIWSIEEELQLNKSDIPIGVLYHNVTSEGSGIAHSVFGSNYPLAAAFDGITNHDGWSASGTIGRWIGLDFNNNPKIISKFRAFSYQMRFRGFIFEASNNNSDWVILTTGELNNSRTWDEFEFDNDIAYRYYRLRCTSVYTGSNVSLSELEMYEREPVYPYLQSEIAEYNLINYTGNYRIIWQEDKPTGTDITVEYTTGQTQGEWIEVSNGEVITSDTSLWFRVTLETTDTSVTPTLHDLWLEEPDAPDDQIRLVMHPQGRFNNVEGSLTVQYDQSQGSLKGRGGPVEGFTETFTPTDLEPKPNPHVAENIEVSAEASVTFAKVTYNQRYADEQITVSASATVDFIHVSEINP